MVAYREVYLKQDLNLGYYGNIWTCTRTPVIHPPGPQSKLSVLRRTDQFSLTPKHTSNPRIYEKVRSDMQKRNSTPENAEYTTSQDENNALMWARHEGSCPQLLASGRSYKDLDNSLCSLVESSLQSSEIWGKKPICIPRVLAAGPYLQYPCLTPGQRHYLNSIAGIYSPEYARRLIQQHYLNVLYRRTQEAKKRVEDQQLLDIADQDLMIPVLVTNSLLSEINAESLLSANSDREVVPEPCPFRDYRSNELSLMGVEHRRIEADRSTLPRCPSMSSCSEDNSTVTVYAGKVSQRKHPIKQERKASRIPASKERKPRNTKREAPVVNSLDMNNTTTRREDSISGWNERTREELLNKSMESLSIQDESNTFKTAE